MKLGVDQYIVDQFCIELMIFFTKSLNIWSKNWISGCDGWRKFSQGFQPTAD